MLGIREDPCLYFHLVLNNRIAFANGPRLIREPDTRKGEFAVLVQLRIMFG
ncbi:MAG: hypothetical protein A4E72_00302 [Syntrophus sp. PtaU1.Bin208]|nr:MAG: hypothetical protein A4E72_00302 [Syntrophus sp. PtaU1.Bin208]